MFRMLTHAFAGFLSFVAILSGIFVIFACTVAVAAAETDIRRFDSRYIDMARQSLEHLDASGFYEAEGVIIGILTEDAPYFVEKVENKLKKATSIVK